MLDGAVIVLVVGIVQLWARAGGPVSTSAHDLRRDPAIQYDLRPTHDPIAELERKLEQGLARLSFDAGGQGYLRSVLDVLGVPIESQVVAFSKTSFQAPRISPSNPRSPRRYRVPHLSHLASDQRRSWPRRRQCLTRCGRTPTGARSHCDLGPSHPARRSMGRVVRDRRNRHDSPSGQYGGHES
jgi:hypothetical protein